MLRQLPAACWFSSLQDVCQPSLAPALVHHGVKVMSSFLKPPALNSRADTESPTWHSQSNKKTFHSSPRGTRTRPGGRRRSRTSGAFDWKVLVGLDDLRGAAWRLRTEPAAVTVRAVYPQLNFSFILLLGLHFSHQAMTFTSASQTEAVDALSGFRQRCWRTVLWLLV